LERIRLKHAGIIFLAGVFACGVAAQTFGPPPTIKSIRIVHDSGAPAVEILSRGGQVFPDIQLVPSPPRLVIDIANSRLGPLPRRIAVHQDNILAIRADQYQDKPPVTRIVLDLQAPYAFSWDGTGDRLMVRLKPAEDLNVAKRVSPQQSVANVSLTPAATIVPVVAGSGKIVAASVLAPGSSVSAVTDTTVLQLRRGGEVRVCPHTTVSVTPARNKRDIMLGMSTGAVEAHDSLDSASDSVITPDFRILFAGPGEFHFAISADSKGNTCVRGLKGNTSSAVVSEVVGDRVYQVKPTEQAVFHLGQIDKVDANVPLECGCPAPPTVEQNESATEVASAKLPDNATLGSAATTEAKSENDPPKSGSTPGPTAGHASLPSISSTDPSATTALTNGPETRPLPALKPDEKQVQLDMPLVFTAKNRAASVPSAPLDETRALPVEDSSLRPVHLDAIVEAPRPKPDAPTKAERHGFFHRLKGLIQTIFG
jgi:AMIN domain